MSVALMLASVAWAQSKSETITRSLEVKNKNIEFWFCVCNINGSVDLEAYDGNTVEVTLEKRVNGKNQTDVDLGMQELQLKSEQGDDFAKLYVSMPGQRMAEKADPLQCGWDWNGNSNWPSWMLCSLEEIIIFWGYISSLCFIGNNFIVHN